jgi:vacuolar-type H+-ATPase subunit E/Vma4
MADTAARCKPTAAEAKALVERWASEIKGKAQDGLKGAAEAYYAEVSAATEADLEQEKQKMRSQFALQLKKEQQNEAVKRSKLVTDGRIARMTAQEDKIAAVAEEAKVQLAGAQNAALITDLIVQGCMMLLEDEVKIRCRKEDRNTVSGVFGNAQKAYEQNVLRQAGKTKQVKLSLDDTPLSPESLGGVVLVVPGGGISVDNTLAARLKLVLEQDKPEIRKALFRA